MAMEGQELDKGYMRIATCNVQMLQPRLDALLDKLVEEVVDLAVLQETRLTADAVPAIQRRASQKGFRVIAGAHQKTSAGVAMGTNITLTRWPATKLTVPKTITAGARVQLIGVHRPEECPFVLANVHFPHQGPAKTNLMRQLQRHLASLGRQAMIIGDFNAEPKEGVITEVLAHGEMCLMDEAAQELGNPGDGANGADQPTSVPARGSGRHIDFGLCSKALRVERRKQIEGVADHDLAMYDVNTKAMEAKFMMQRSKLIPNPTVRNNGEDLEQEVVEDEIPEDRWKDDKDSW
jgi:endonuclease/exonuclease/phosphatase family metal-dependent hydrolase